jgi:hypothetical protein
MIFIMTSQIETARIPGHARRVGLFFVRSGGTDGKQCRSGVTHRIAAGGQHILQFLKLNHQRIGQLTHLSGGVVSLGGGICQCAVGLLVQQLDPIGCDPLRPLGTAVSLQLAVGLGTVSQLLDLGRKGIALLLQLGDAGIGLLQLGSQITLRTQLRQLLLQHLHLGVQLVYLGSMLVIDIFDVADDILAVETANCAAEILNDCHGRASYHTLFGQVCVLFWNYSTYMREKQLFSQKMAARKTDFSKIPFTKRGKVAIMSEL